MDSWGQAAARSLVRAAGATPAVLPTPPSTALTCPAFPALPIRRPVHRYILKAGKHPKFNRAFTMLEG